MKNFNKRNKSLAMILIVMVVLALSVLSINLLNERSKSISIKSTYEIDKRVEVCYINCNGVKEYKYDSIITQVETWQQKARVIAHEERKAQIAAEQVRIAEAERRERARLAKVELDKQREIRREMKKKQVATVSRSNSESSGQWIQFEATYYSAFCNTGCTGITALGWNVSNTIYYNGHRVIAVDPKIIPLGSLVQVKTPHETFYALAGDTGGAIKQYHIDILVGSTKTAYALGRHPVQVRILKSK